MSIQDQDSWSGGTGNSDQKPAVLIFRLLDGWDLEPVSCRRSRLRCQGCYACSELDPKLLDVEQFELDPASHEAIFHAKGESRSNEGSTADKTVATYVVCHS